MSAAPVYSFVDQGIPEGYRLAMFVIDGRVQHFMCPDNGKIIWDMPLADFRPYPAYDAMVALAAISGLTVKQLLNVREIDGVI